MRHAVLAGLVLVVIGTTLASEPGQSDTTTDPNTAQSQAPPKEASAVRQSEDADLIVKEWHSPITFEIDVDWLAALPMEKPKEIEDLPSFYCDNATLDSMTVTKTRPRSGIVRLKIDFALSVQESSHDKAVDLEFTLLSGDARLPLGRDSDLKVAEGRSLSSWVWYEKPDERFAPYMTEGSNPRLRISMIVRNN